jgi:hypothetical protein
MLRKGRDKPFSYNDYENKGAGLTPPESLQFEPVKMSWRLRADSYALRNQLNPGSLATVCPHTGPLPGKVATQDQALNRLTAAV